MSGSESLKTSPHSFPQSSRRYWRSLDRLLDSPAVQEGLGPEFPEGADLPPDAMSRRTMMTIMGASFAFAGLQGCRRPVEKIVPYVDAPETIVPGVPRYYASTMPLGSSAYGVLVESHEGRPTKIEGNELHPSSQGAASLWMQAEVLSLYDPDRSGQVMRRTEGGGAEDHGEGDHGADGHAAEAGASNHAVASWEDFEAFWQDRIAELGDGSGLAVVSTSYSSPTMARLRAALEAAMPAARWVVHEPAGDGNVFAGTEMATGGAHRPVYHLENASVVVALDADVLHTESDSVRNARGFARSRRVRSTADDMSRLYAVESTLTVTGSNADHRIRMKAGEVAGFAAALAGGVGLSVSGATTSGDTLADDKLAAIVEDLKHAGSSALVIAGRRQPPEVHAMALAINQALGSIGTTVSLHERPDAAESDAEALQALVADVEAGAINTVVVLGGNPTYDTPADVDFAGALSKAHSVHLSTHFDETSRSAEWHLPGTHFLESWGDARAADGTLSVVQPLIAPLFGGRSALELANLVATGSHQPGYDLVRETWASTLDATNFEKAWRKALHDGLLEAPSAPAAPAALSDLSSLAIPAPADGLEISFHVSSDVYDGRYANNSWLQELPDAITKVTWDNAALVSPATARELGLEVRASVGETGRKPERLALTYRGHTVVVPVVVQPGQADGSIAVFLGYGRTAAGRVGDGIGYSAFAVRHSAAPWFDGGVMAQKAAGRHNLVQTQEHWAMSDWEKSPQDRPLVLETSLADYKEHPDFVHHAIHTPADSQLFNYHSYEEGYQWGMTIDLNACTGCNACVVACQSENNIPVVGKEQVSRGREMHWLRIDRYYTSPSRDFEEMAADPAVVFQPIPCMHCENAPCEQVCPVAATVHDAEGINAMVYNRCIGTRYCSNNCPYKVRRFNFFNYTKDTPELMKIAQNPDVTVRSRGVMEKCTYCLQRVSEAKIEAKREGRAVRDGDIKTACQQTCPSEAITFGNVRDAESQVAKSKENERNYVLLGELNNRPRTSFWARLGNPNPHWPGAAAAAPHHGESEG